MISIPTALLTFTLSVFVGLIVYIWRTTQAMITKLDDRITSMERRMSDKDSLTGEMLRDMLDSRFNEFRLELYKSGVLKPPPRKTTK